jgi:hypothetical protein
LREKLGAGNKNSPKLALLYTPFMIERFPGEYIDVISSIDPKVPVFGAVANAKETVDSLGGNLTLCNGNASKSDVVLVLISGDFTPKFFVSHFTETSVVLKDIGVVTKCEKSILKEINGVNAADFLEKVGFSEVRNNYDHFNSGLLTTAFILDCGSHGESDAGESQIVSRSPHAITDEGVHCVGHIREGAKISVAFSTPESVVETARGIVGEIADSGGQTALIYSCLGRRVGLMNNSLEELRLIKSGLSEKINYTVTYVGGEISPVAVDEGLACNHEHNQTLIACVF